MIFLCCSTVPEYMPSPHVSPVSSSSLRVSWETPQDKDVRGEVTEYRVNLHQEQMSNPYAPRIVTQVSISAHSTFFLSFFWWKRATASIFWCVVGTQLWSFSGYIVLYFASSITQNSSCCSSFSLICVAVLIESCTIPLKWKNMAVTFISVQFYISIACALCPSMHMVWAELSKKVSSITHVNLCGVFFFVRVANL